VTVAVLTFVNELCGFWHMAHIFHDIIEKIFSFVGTASYHNLPLCFFINQIIIWQYTIWDY